MKKKREKEERKKKRTKKHPQHRSELHGKEYDRLLFKCMYQCCVLITIAFYMYKVQ